MSGFLENLENFIFPDDEPEENLYPEKIQYESSVDQNMIDLLGPSNCECGKCRC
jgi:hypothetical protein